MNIHTNFILLVSKFPECNPEMYLFKRFSLLCDYVKEHALTKNECKVFLRTLQDISEYEHTLIPYKI